MSKMPDQLRSWKEQAQHWETEARAMHALLFQKDAEIERLTAIATTEAEDNCRLRVALERIAEAAPLRSDGASSAPILSEIARDALQSRH